MRTGLWSLVLMMVGAWMEPAARAQEPAPLEPDTVSHGTAWQDDLWTQSATALPQVPTTAREEWAQARAQGERILSDGVTAGDTQVLLGTQQTNDIFHEHARRATGHARAAVMDIVLHAKTSRDGWAKAAQRAGTVAAQNVSKTQAAWTLASDLRVRTDHRVWEVANNVGHRAAEQRGTAWEKTGALAQAGSRDARAASEQAQRRARGELLQAHEEGAVNFEAASHTPTQQWAHWTAQQWHRGVEDTPARVAQQAAETWSSTQESANAAWDTMLALDLQRVANTWEVYASGLQQRWQMQDALDKESQGYWHGFDAVSEDLASKTVLRIPAAVKESAASTQRDAAALWDLGYHNLLAHSVHSWGDNLFAGDVEGLLVGTYEAAVLGVQGGVVLLALEPMAAVGNTVAGAAQVAVMGGGGAVALAALQGARVVWMTSASLLGGAALAGLYAVSTGALLFATAQGWASTLGGAFWGVTQTAWTLGLGGAVTAAVAGAGAVSTLADVAHGVAATLWWATAGKALAQGLALAKTALVLGAALGVGAWGMAVPWLALSLVGLARAALLSVTLAAWSVLPAGAHAAALLQSGLSGVLLVGGVGALGVFLNLGVTPLMVLWEGVLAGGRTLSVFLEDPILAAMHGAVGVLGYTARTTALRTAATAAVAGGSALAVGQAAARLIHHGGGLTLAGGAILGETLLGRLLFLRHAARREERKPQIEALLRAQPPDVQAQVGTGVRYIRVRFAGPDRGKVDFFTTQAPGSPRFTRKVGRDCAVTYESPQAHLTLFTGWHDRRCQEGA